MRSSACCLLVAPSSRAAAAPRAPAWTQRARLRSTQTSLPCPSVEWESRRERVQCCCYRNFSRFGSRSDRPRQIPKSCLPFISRRKRGYICARGWEVDWWLNFTTSVQAHIISRYSENPVTVTVFRGPNKDLLVLKLKVIGYSDNHFQWHFFVS